MPDPLQALLAAGLVPTNALPATSRYAGVGTTAHHPPAGGQADPIAHLRRRLVPAPERFATLHEVTATAADRRDLLAATHLGDPELWWRIADANGVIDPAGMTTVGRRLRITTAVDLPGAPT